VPGDGGNSRSDAEGYRFELRQFIHHSLDLAGIRSLGVENRFGVIEDDEHIPGGKEWSERCETLWIFDPRSNDLGEAGEEMSTRSWELVTPDEPTVHIEPLLDVIMVEDRERDGGFPNSPSTNESDGFQVFGKSNDLLDQAITAKTGPWGWGRQFSQGNAISGVRLWTGNVYNH
jgi:hypothetical protein